MGNEVVEPTIDALVAAVISANRKINNRSRDEAELSGMGTTVTAMALVSDDEGERLGVVNVGDSRTYVVDDEELVQLTDDHSLVGEMLRSGQLTKEEALDHPQRNILTRALGVDSEVEVDWYEIQIRAGRPLPALHRRPVQRGQRGPDRVGAAATWPIPTRRPRNWCAWRSSTAVATTSPSSSSTSRRAAGDEGRGVVGSRITRRSGVEPDPAGFTSAAALDAAAADAAADGCDDRRRRVRRRRPKGRRR